MNTDPVAETPRRSMLLWMSRKNLIPLLLDTPKSVLQLAREAHMPARDIEDDLEHLLKSVKHMNYTAEITPAQCRKCGFEFSSEKLGKPSRCPECKGDWLTEPKVMLRKKSQTTTS